MDIPRLPDSPSVSKHKRQLAWQILVPFLVMAALIIALAVLIITGSVMATRTWADVSLIWMILPVLFLALIGMAVLGFLIFGLARLMQVAPRFTGKVQSFFAAFSGRTRRIADGTARPFIWFQQVGAVIKSIFRV